LDPARVLATTFTKKAAAELKGRIQAKLLAGTEGRLANQHHADRLELAAIGTVHSVAHQMLSRYAIELGLSPRLEVITDEASDRALSDLLGAIPAEAWQPLVDGAERLGINDLHRRVLELMAAKRGNQISDGDFTDQMNASADQVCQLLASDGVATGETSLSQLYDMAEQALASVDALTTDVTAVTSKAKQKLRQLKSKRISLWGSYLEASKIKAGKKSGADALLDPLRNHAAQVNRNPRLHSDIRDFASSLATETIRLVGQYENYKKERGLVDFTDLEILLLKLLDDESLAAQLSEDFDLVLVDEFQDTNPLQLAIFQQLRRLSPRTRWVGDPKQAIYGFRDTDPALVDDIWKNATDATRTELPNNHRSIKSHRSREWTGELKGGYLTQRIKPTIKCHLVVACPNYMPRATGLVTWRFWNAPIVNCKPSQGPLTSLEFPTCWQARVCSPLGRERLFWQDFGWLLIETILWPPPRFCIWLENRIKKLLIGLESDSHR